MSEVAISAPMRSASLRIASPAPDQIAPRPATITGFFAFAMTSSARLSDVVVGARRALRQDRRGRLVRLVVLELLLLHVHRRAQHDRARFELREIERLAHDVVRALGRVDADETGFARGRETRLVEALVVAVVDRSDARRRTRRAAIRRARRRRTPVASCVTPGPQVAVATPGVCVARAQPSAMPRPTPSWRTSIKLRRRACRARVHQYMLPSPIMPKTADVPSALNACARRS